MEREAVETRLLDAGLLRREGSQLRTTPRWQAAVMRAAQRLMRENPEGEPIAAYALALVDLFPEANDQDIAAMALALLPVELAEAGSPHP